MCVCIAWLSLCSWDHIYGRNSSTYPSGLHSLFPPLPPLPSPLHAAVPIAPQEERIQRSCVSGLVNSFTLSIIDGKIFAPHESFTVRRPPPHPTPPLPFARLFSIRLTRKQKDLFDCVKARGGCCCWEIIFQSAKRRERRESREGGREGVEGWTAAGRGSHILEVSE